MTLGQMLLLSYVAWLLAGWLAMRLIDEPMSEVGVVVMIGGPLVALLFIGLPPDPRCQSCGHRKRDHDFGGPLSPRPPRRKEYPCCVCNCQAWVEVD